MTTQTNGYSTHYVNTPFGDGGLKGWLKVAGNKPADEHFKVAALFAKRPGKQTMAHALALRPEGVSGSDIMLVCGAQQLNHMRGLIDAGYFARDMNAPRDAKGRAVYKLTLTKKGEGELAKREAKVTAGEGEVTTVKASKKAKVKATSKPRKAKVAPAVTEAPAEVTAQAPVTSEAPADHQPQA